MRQAYITCSGIEMDFRKAAALAASLADDDPAVVEPILVAWHDRKEARNFPAVDGNDLRYAESHGGKLEVDVGDDYTFVFAESSAFEPYEASPYSNLKDENGVEYICQINKLRDPHKPDAEACTPVNDWMSKLT